MIMMVAFWGLSGHDSILMALSGMSEENPKLLFDDMYIRLKNPFIMLLGILFVILYTAVMILWYLCISGIATYAVKWWKADGQT